jgi:hypothetical protein
MCKIDATLLWLFGAAIVQNTVYGMIAPFLTLKLEEFEIGGGWSGLIFACYAAAVIFWSPIVMSPLLIKYTGGKLIPCGMLLMGIVFTLYGLIPYMEGSPGLIITYCCVLRGFQGIAAATI